MRIETIGMEKLLCLLNAIFLKSSPDFLKGLLIYNVFIVKHKSQRIFYCPAWSYIVIDILFPRAPWKPGHKDLVLRPPGDSGDETSTKGI